MPRSSSPLHLVAVLIILWCALVGLTLGIAGALGETGQMRLLFLVMAAAGAGMGISGARMFLEWRRAVRRESEHQQAIRGAVRRAPPPVRVEPARAANGRVSAPVAGKGKATKPANAAAAPAAGLPVLSSGEPVLAHWTYAAEEWRQYTRGEWGYRAVEAVGMGGGIVLFGWLIGRNEEGNLGLWAGIVVGAVIFVGKLVQGWSARSANRSGPGEAIITPTAVMLNGQYHVLSNDEYRFEHVRIDRLARPPVLEFKVSWNTREGRTHTEVRVPIPAGREDEAQRVVEAFQRGWAVRT